MEKENEECCPPGESCEVPVEKEVKLEEIKHVNPYEIPYVPSSHVQELMARRKKRDKEKLKIVQKKK